MGAAPSKEVSDQEIMKSIDEKKMIVDQVVVDNITNLSGLLKEFSSNDTNAIVQRIKNMEEFKGKIPDNILDRVSKVHESLLDTIDSNLSVEEKKKRMETDTGLANYIQQYVGKDLDAKMKDYLENPFIKNDPIVKSSMEDVTNSIKQIRSKYKYFEYKYVQLNMFLILFTKHVYQTVNRFMNETSAFYEAREKYHLVLIHNVIKTFQEQLGAETKQLTDLDTSKFTDSIGELSKSIMDTITQQKNFAEKQKQDSLQEILKFLMTQEKSFAEEIIKGVDSYKSEQQKLAPQPAPQPAQPQPQLVQPLPQPQPPVYGPIDERPDFIAADTFIAPKPGYVFKTSDKGKGYYKNTSVMRGGFIKGSSMIPQNFYAL